MPKAPDAFRTISEVADWLEVQTHVLRFWETKFPQVKPLKRAGGRRYYRPADMLLLGGIKRLLHDDGMTIKGVQKMLRERGVREVSDLSRPLRTDEEGYLTVAPAANAPRPPRPRTVPPVALPEMAHAEAPYVEVSAEMTADRAADGSTDRGTDRGTDAPTPSAPAHDAPMPPVQAQTQAQHATPSALTADDAPALDAPEAPFIDMSAPSPSAEESPPPPAHPDTSPDVTPNATAEPTTELATEPPSMPRDLAAPVHTPASQPHAAPEPSTDTPAHQDPDAHHPIGVATDGLAEPRENPLHDPAEPEAEIHAPRPQRPGGYGIADGAIQAPPSPQDGTAAPAMAAPEPGPMISRQLAHSLPGDATRARLRPIYDALLALRERMTKNP